MKKLDIFWQTYMNLEKEVIEMSKYILLLSFFLSTSKPQNYGG